MQKQNKLKGKGSRQSNKAQKMKKEGKENSVKNSAVVGTAPVV